MRAKQRIHTIDIFDNDSIMIRSTAINSVANTLKKIHLSETLLNLFTSTYYDDNNDSFEMLFQKYTAIYINIIYHRAIIGEL